MSEIARWLSMSELDHWAVREWVNGLWFVVSLAMAVEFGIKFYDRVTRYGPQWREDLGTKSVAALFGYFLGESIIRGWVWLVLVVRNSGYVSETLEGMFYLAFVAAAISTASAMWCLYLFSNRHWSWVRSSIFIFAFVSVSTTVQMLY